MSKGDVTDVPLRKNWRFQLLWIGTGVSNLGSTAIGLALPVLILFTTGSPALAGLAATITMGSSILLGAPAGVWVDRLDRRRILLTAEASQALIWGAFAFIVYLDAVTAWNVMLVAALSGAATAFTSPAYGSALQALVPKPQLATAYAQGQARAYAIQLGGPPVGGLLYAISRVAPFLFQLFASVVALVCYFAARVPRRPLNEPGPGAADQATQPPPAAKKSMRQDIAEALRWLLQQPGLRAVLGVALFINPLVNAIWVPIIVLVNERGGAALDAGVIMAGVGVGGLIGALLSARASKLVPAGRLVLIVGFLMGLCYCLTPLPLGMYWPIIPIIISCLASPALNVAIMALLGHIVPSNMMGRMTSLMNVTFLGLAPLGPLFGGLLAASLGGGSALIICGLSIVAVTAIASASPSLRNLRVPTDPGGESTDSTSAGEPEPQQPGDAQTPQPDGESLHLRVGAQPPQLDPETIRQLYKAGIITTTVPAAAAFSNLNAEEADFLVSLSARLQAASDAEVVAQGTDPADSGGDP